jgi:hypothetical protein
MRRPPAGLEIDVGDRRPRSASDQRRRDGAADPLRAAGDERALADELEVRLTRDRHFFSPSVKRALTRSAGSPLLPLREKVAGDSPPDEGFAPKGALCRDLRIGP